MDEQTQDNLIETIRGHYIERVLDHSIEEYKVLDWESKEAQMARFSAFTRAFNLSGSSILDVGCGLGHLAEYIDNQNISLNYLGIDIMPEMIERARAKQFANIKTRFISGDIFEDDGILASESIDYIYSSGIFNLNLGNNKEFLMLAIKYFITVASSGVCFNLLDSCCEKLYGSKYFYYEKEDARNIVVNVLKRLDIKYSLNISDDYLSNDFSIVVKILP